MKLYIRATGNVSPQRTFGHPPFLAEPVLHNSNAYVVWRPDLPVIHRAKLIRRMSRIYQNGSGGRHGMPAGSSTAEPDAIVTGTAYGCMEDTGVFLEKMISNRKKCSHQPLSSSRTHNTVGAQIALILGCHRYHNTFVHKGFSFEAPYLDSMMQIRDGDAEQVLQGVLMKSPTPAMLYYRALAFTGMTKPPTSTSFATPQKVPSQRGCCILFTIR
jgi:hypothetical protein